MRPIGFSTGALAYADFREALAILRGTGVEVLELSALREAELDPLLAALGSLDLSQFRYISLHAPSSFCREAEEHIVGSLYAVADRGWPIVVHPDAICQPALWEPLGAAVCVENMDTRKPFGRSAAELSRIFDLLPDAGFCFDIGHARQFDGTMTEAYLLLTRFAGRLKQVHVSEVNTAGKHDIMSFASIHAFREVAHLIPPDVPLILETPTHRETLRIEMDRVRDALPVVTVA
jgi:hypothetical protein